jgi:SAM-dependent methyltransferase
MRSVLLLCAAAIAWSSAAAWAQDTTVARPALRQPDVRYEPTETEVVQVMLRDVKAGDLVFDLGCGDGRIVISAARQAGARGVCVDIDPVRIAESRENARRENVSDRVEFRNEDLFTTDISGASVMPELNLKLRPRLLGELKPGTRIVSHWHDMGDWTPQEIVPVTSRGRQRNVYLWTIPERQ